MYNIPHSKLIYVSNGKPENKVNIMTKHIIHEWHGETKLPGPLLIIVTSVYAFVILSHLDSPLNLDKRHIQ